MNARSKRRTSALAGVVCTLVAGLATAQTRETGYTAKAWNSLSPDYFRNSFSAGDIKKCTDALARAGATQSPIRLTVPPISDPDLTAVDFSEYGSNSRRATLENNGHSVEAAFSGGPTIGFRGQRHTLQQLHFHHPSEHIWGSERYHMELHLVHDNAGRKTVVAVPMRAQGDTDHAGLKAIFDKMTSTSSVDMKDLGTKVPEQEITTAGLEAVLPANRDYLAYTGSLTTPGCGEPVQWVVLRNPITISTAQLDKFKNAITYNKPSIQMNARAWTEDNTRAVRVYSSGSRTADLRQPTVAARNLTFRPGPNVSAQGQNGRSLDQSGNSYVDFTFTLDAPKPLKLSLVHLTTTGPWPKPGFAPVTISANGEVIRAGYDVSAAHGGNRDFQWDQFMIPASALNKGGNKTNTVRISLDPHARQKYWLMRVVIDDASSVASR